MNYFILNCQTNSLEFKDWFSILALVVSLIALGISIFNSNRNFRLSIQQTIYKTISDKAKDCNLLWESESEHEKNNSPHFKVISELIITLEVIDNSFSLFESNYENIRKDYSVNFYKLFYKQLRTDLRQWIQRTPEIAKSQNSKVFSDQVQRLQTQLGPYFEKTGSKSGEGPDA